MSTSKYPNEIKINPNQGGKAAIERLVEAYGFSTRQALCDHLGISKSTLANRYMRDTFPSDWIIQCSIETGISLRWLSTGEGGMVEFIGSDVISVKRLVLENGSINENDFCSFDKKLLPASIKNPEIISVNTMHYLIERDFGKIVDGKWVLKIDGLASVHELIRMPKEMVKVSSGNLTFDSHIDDIEFYAFVFGTINNFTQSKN